MSECSVYLVFETEEKAKRALSRLQPEELPKFRLENRLFHFVDGGKPNGNPCVIEVKMEYYVSWAVPAIANILRPVEVTMDMKPLWRRPRQNVSMALGVAA